MPTGKKKLPVVRILLAFAVGLLVWNSWDFISDTAIGLTYQPQPEVAEVIEHLALTGDGTRILRASRPALQQAEDFNHNCTSVSAETSTLGCYFMRQIYVYDIDNEELAGIKEAVLAHELLHAVWERLPGSEKSQLTPLLQRTYDENQSELSEHMESYESADFVDELHSVIGTQLDTSKIGSELRAHYAKYFTNQERIIEYFAAYDEKLTGLRKTALALHDEIQNMKADIDARSAAYEQNNNQLNQDIDNYNARAGAGYRTEAERVALNNERNALIRRQELMQQEYDALSALVDSANQKVATYNEMVEHLGSLMQSIDSTYIPKVEEPTN